MGLKEVGKWFVNDCPVVSNVCSLASDSAELVKETWNDPGLLKDSFCYAWDGHDDKVEKKIVANFSQVSEMINDIRNTGINGIPRVKDDIHAGLKDLMSVHGISDCLGAAFNESLFDSILDNFASASKELGDQLANAVDEIQKYQSTGTLQKLGVNALYGCAKFSTGLFKVGGDIIDAGAILVAGGASLVTGGKDNKVSTAVKNFVAKEWIDDTLDAVGFEECFHDLGAVSPDSFWAGGTEAMGTVASYYVGGKAMQGISKGITGTSKLATAAKTVFGDAVYSQTAFAGVQGLGSGAGRALTEDPSMSSLGALWEGTKQGGEQAAAAFITGKLIEKGVNKYYDAKALKQLEAQSKTANQEYETAKSAYEKAQQAESEAFKAKCNDPGNPELDTQWQEAVKTTDTLAQQVEEALANKTAIDGQLNGIKGEDGLLKDAQKTQKTAEKEYKSAEKTAEKVIEESGLKRGEYVEDPAELANEGKRINKRMKDLDTEVERAQARETEIRETAKAEGRQLTEAEASEITGLKENVFEAQSELADLKVQQRVNDALQNRQAAGKTLKDAETTLQDLKENASSSKTKLKEAKQQYKEDSKTFKEADEKAFKKFDESGLKPDEVVTDPEKLVAEGERIQQRLDETKPELEKLKARETEIRDKARIEGREITPDEVSELDSIKTKMEPLESEVKKLTTQQEVNKAFQERQTSLEDMTRSSRELGKAEMASKGGSKIEGEQPNQDPKKVDDLRNKEIVEEAREIAKRQQYEEATAEETRLRQELAKQQAAGKELDPELYSKYQQAQAKAMKLNDELVQQQEVVAEAKQATATAKAEYTRGMTEGTGYGKDLTYEDLTYRERTGKYEPIKSKAALVNDLKAGASNLGTDLANANTALKATANVLAPYAIENTISGNIKGTEIPKSAYSIDGVKLTPGKVGPLTKPFDPSTGGTGSNTDSTYKPTITTPSGGDTTTPTGGGDIIVPTGGGDGNQNTYTGGNGGNQPYYPSSTGTPSGTTNPGTSNPGTSNPGTSNPGTSNPGTTNPGTTNPGTPIPGTTNPGTTNPGTTNPGTPIPGGEVYNPANNDNTGSYHTGGGYTSTGGYTSSGGYTTGGTNSTSIPSTKKAATSIDDIVKGNKYTKVPTSTTPITPKNQSGSGLGNVIPIAAGLSAAAAAGIGAKAYLDRKKNNDNGEYDEDSDDDFGAEEWNGDENTIEVDYDDSSDTKTEQYLDDDDELGYETEPEERYGARNNEELADLQ